MITFIYKDQLYCWLLSSSHIFFYDYICGAPFFLWELIFAFWHEMQCLLYQSLFIICSRISCCLIIHCAIVAVQICFILEGFYNWLLLEFSFLHIFLLHCLSDINMYLCKSLCVTAIRDSLCLLVVYICLHKYLQKFRGMIDYLYLSYIHIINSGLYVHIS